MEQQFGDNGLYSRNAINFLFGGPDQSYQWQTPVLGYEEIEWNRRRLDAMYGPNGTYNKQRIKQIFGGLGSD